MLDMELLIKNLSEYLKNGKEDLEDAALCRVLDIVLEGGPVKDIDFTLFELDDIETALEEIMSTRTMEEYDDEEDQYISRFETFLEAYDTTYAFTQAKPLGGEEIDFI